MDTYRTIIKLLATLICFLIFLAPFCASASESRVIPSTDITYIGAFKLPSPGSGNVWQCFDAAGYNRPDMSMSGDGNLYVMGGPGTTVTQDWRIAKISIPTPLDTTYENLNTASLLVNLTDVDGFDQSGCYTRMGGMTYMPAQGSQSNAKLYISLYASYSSLNVYDYDCDSVDELNGSLAWGEDNLSAFNRQGWWKLNGPTVSYYGKYLFDAPTSLSWLNGKYLITGYCRGGGSPSEGPTMYAIDPWNYCGGDPIDCDANPPSDGTTITELKLLEYDSDIPNILSDGAKNDAWSSGVWVTVGNKSAIVFYGQKRLRTIANWEWSYPNGPPFVSSPNEGYHDEPGRSVLLFYDPADIQAVAGGSKEPYEPQPYAIVELGPYLYNGYSTSKIEYGMAYDRTNQKLYIRETSDSYNAIHAFSLVDNGTTLDTTPPSKPVLTVGTVTHEAASFSWDACTDNRSGDITYIIYKNGKAIAAQKTTSFTDDLYEYYHSPVEYYVVAEDFEGNTTQSDSIYIDDEDGGNAPIAFFCPALSPTVSAAHETMRVPQMIKDQSYSFTPSVIGGNGSYTWSISGFPSGISINSSTGEISGTPTTIESSYVGIITVQDSNGNLFRQRVSWGVCDSGSSYVNDRDGDGYDTVTEGDSNDLSINVHPGNPVQPAPSNLTITTDGTGVLLSWDDAQQRQDIHETKDWRRLQGEITYEVHWGTSPGSYSNSKYVGRTTSCRITNLNNGTNYFAITAYAYRGLESDYSNEVSTGMLNGSFYGAYHAEGEDEKVSIAATSDGGYAIASFTSSYTWLNGPGTEVRNILLLKTNSDGIEQWRRVVGPMSYNITSKQTGTSSNYHWATHKVIESGTDLVICGHKQTATTGYDVSLMKFNSSGTNLWDKSFNGSGNGNDYAFDVIEKTGGGYALACQLYATSTDAGLILTDTNGENATYGYYNTNGKGWETARYIIQTSDGGFLLCGWTETGAIEDEDFYVLKTTSSGTLSWAQKYDNSNRRDKAFSAQEDSSGNFWVFGRTQSTTVENTKIWILKLNSSGVLQSSYEIGGTGDSDVYVCKGSLKLASGNFVLIGYTNDSGGAGYDGYLTEINLSGIQQWSKIIGADTENHEDYLQSLILDGLNYVCVGTNNSAVTSAYDMWLLKLATSDRSVANYTGDVSKTTFYYDKDLDGLGNNNQWTPATEDCTFAMPGYVTNNNDTDDSNPEQGSFHHYYSGQANFK